MQDTITTFIIALIPILGIWIGFLLNKNLKLKEQINVDKRKVYLKYMDILKDILASTKNKESLDQNKIDKEMREFIINSIFWAPEKVLNAIREMQKMGRGDVAEKAKENPLVIFEKNFGVILVMREDLGLCNKGVTWKTLAQMIVTEDIE